MLQPVFGVEMALEQFTGANASGSDGDTNRVLAATNVTQAKGEITVTLDKQTLRKTDDYTVSGNNITFLSRLLDRHKIDVRYIK